MSTPSPSMAQALARWRGNLIDLARRNPLIALRSTLALSHPSSSAIWQRVVREGESCNFWLPPLDEDEDGVETEPAAIDLEHIQTKPGDIVCGDLGRRALLRTLTNLYRRSTAAFHESGLQILHLAFGVLHWSDQDNTHSFRSPLVLVPVELERSSLREPFRVKLIEEEPFLNSALSARLQQDYSFQLPAVPETWDVTDIAEYFGQVEAAIAGLPGWKMEPAAMLALFPIFKGKMCNDLQDHAAKAMAHPVVRALAGEAGGDVLTPSALPTEDELDAVQSPAKTFTILDADASQRLCLEAAARGHSFVLLGPPGTGKSQTIANLIADCLATGKKVLFVSEKMVALQVVYNRLRDVGLGDYCLDLSSYNVSTAAVMQELKRCLEVTKPATGNAMTEQMEKLDQRQRQLTDYVRALHQPREPLERSMWWALGELVRCGDVPSIAWKLADGTAMTPTWLEEARQAVQRAQNLWHIPQQGQDYPWWGFKVGERYTLKLRDEVIAQIDKARKQLDRLGQVADQCANQIGAKGSVAWLLRAGELLESSPRPPAAWLSAGDLPQLAADLDKCAELYRERGQSRTPLTERYGPGLWNLPIGTAANIDAAWHQAAPLLAPGDEKGAALLTRQQQLRGWAADTQKRIPLWLTEARTIEKWLNVALPRGEGASAAQDDPSPFWLKKLLRLAHLCESENAPEKAWVTDASACAHAKTLIEAHQPVLAAYHERRNRLLLTYTDQLFELDLERIAEGFEGPYRSWLRVFNMEYRRDRRAITRRTRDHLVPANIREDTFVGRDLMRDQARLESEHAQRQAILGRYEKGLATDCEAATRATRVAEEAVQLVHEIGCEKLPDKFVDALSAAGPPVDKIRAAIKRLQESVGTWWHATEELKDFLPILVLPGTGQPIEESAVSALLNYARDLQTCLNHFASLADPVLTKAKTQPPDAVTLVADMREAELVQQQESLQETENARWAVRFGPAFQGMATDWTALKKALTWTIRVREHFARAATDWQPPAAESKTGMHKAAAGGTGVPPSAYVQLATPENHGAGATRDLRLALEQFEHALHSFEIRFEPPAPLAAGKRLASLPLDDCKKQLAELRERASELSQWVDWQQLSQRFEHLGLAPFWAELQKARPPREQLVDVFVKSTLKGWVDRVFQEEPALGGFQRQEHERELAEFRELDRQLLHSNAHRVAATAAAGRPQPAQMVQISHLISEAQKASRHLPVRRLFEEIADPLLELKPCILMSPVSVSRFLDPAKVLFDVVVFDESSQIRTEDAIGAILRGKQVIVAGDPNQLPPTELFRDLGADEDDMDLEFVDGQTKSESLLDACLSAGIQTHHLRWHHRSRREGLITYSNRQFYGNRLITFPGPLTSSDAMGVEFKHVADAVYHRDRRDNLREAEVMADLVLGHFRDHGHGKTLGVIALSLAQASAIEDEIERRLTQEPALEPLLKPDRLEGFFVKNLEAVQGDERDVILLSFGYGRDSTGNFATDFGPLSRQDGPRWLNVAVTRAREKLVVVSSIRAADIDVTSAKAEGVQHLHRYLDFAERGLVALEQAGPLDGGQPDSPLEADVIQAICNFGGYHVLPQVGCSDYRIDLGVIDPAAPGQFLLGIECDGPGYSATPTARDRDRLRQEVLEKLGWRLHRIWSTEWFQRRHQEVVRLREALEAAKAAAPKRQAAKPPAPLQKVGAPTNAAEIADKLQTKGFAKEPVLSLSKGKASP